MDALDPAAVTETVRELSDIFSANHIYGLMAFISGMFLVQFSVLVWILRRKFKQAETDRETEAEERRNMWENYKEELATLREERDQNRDTFSTELSVERAMAQKREQELGSLLEQRHAQHIAIVERVTTALNTNAAANERVLVNISEQKRLLEKFFETLSSQPNLTCKHCPDLVESKRRDNHPGE